MSEIIEDVSYEVGYATACTRAVLSAVKGARWRVMGCAAFDEVEALSSKIESESMIMIDNLQTLADDLAHGALNNPKMCAIEGVSAVEKSLSGWFDYAYAIDDIICGAETSDIGLSEVKGEVLNLVNGLVEIKAKTLSCKSELEGDISIEKAMKRP